MVNYTIIYYTESHTEPFEIHCIPVYFQCDAPETGELDDIINDEESTDSEEPAGVAGGGSSSGSVRAGVSGSGTGSKSSRVVDSRIPSVAEVTSLPMDQSYVVKRMSQSNGTVYYQPNAAGSAGAGNAGVLASSGAGNGSDSISSKKSNFLSFSGVKSYLLFS